jgi:hypothetical protein
LFLGELMFLAGQVNERREKKMKKL